MMVRLTHLALGYRRRVSVSARGEGAGARGVPCSYALSGDGRGRMGDHESAVSISTGRSL